MKKRTKPTKKPTQALKIPPADDDRSERLPHVYPAVMSRLLLTANEIDTLAYDAERYHHTDARSNLQTIITEAEALIALAQEALAMSRTMTPTPKEW